METLQTWVCMSIGYGKIIKISSIKIIKFNLSTCFLLLNLFGKWNLISKFLSSSWKNWLRIWKCIRRNINMSAYSIRNLELFFCSFMLIFRGISVKQPIKTFSNWLTWQDKFCKESYSQYWIRLDLMLLYWQMFQLEIVMFLICSRFWAVIQDLSPQ